MNDKLKTAQLFALALMRGEQYPPTPPVLLANRAFDYVDAMEAEAAKRTTVITPEPVGMDAERKRAWQNLCAMQFDPLTQAFIAIGAARALDAEKLKIFRDQHGHYLMPDNIEGETAYIGNVMRHAPMVGALFESEELADLPSVFYYDVAEEFGKQFGLYYLRGWIADTDEDAKEFALQIVNKLKRGLEPFHAAPDQ